MVENTEDEKIREDSNEGLDSSGAAAIDYAATAVVVPTDAADAAAATVVVVLYVLLQKQQLYFQNGDDSTAHYCRPPGFSLEFFSLTSRLETPLVQIINGYAICF